MTDVVWLVGTAEEIGELEAHVDPIDAMVVESWPRGVDAEIVALVRSAAGDADTALAALGRRAARFDDEDSARQAAIGLAQRDGDDAG